MNLTIDERKTLEHLRRQQLTWRWLRFVMLGFGVIETAVATYLRQDAVRQLAELSTGAKQMPETVLYLSSLAASELAVHTFLAWVGIALIAWSVVRWHGNPSVTLLIKLVDAQQEPPSAASTSASVLSP